MNGPDDAELNGIALSPDGRTLAVTDFYNEIFFVDARTYERIGEPLHLGSWVDSVAYGPSGMLAYGGDGYIRLVDPRTRHELAVTSIAGRASRLAFTRDGSKLVVMSESASIYVRDGATLKPIGPPIRLDGFTPSFIRSYFRPPQLRTDAGRSLAVTASEEGALAWWDLETGRGRGRSRSRTATTRPRSALTAARWPSASDGGIQLVDVRTGASGWCERDLTGSSNALLFSPDGTTVVSANEDGTVTLWDARVGARRETLRGHSNAVQQPVFSADGTRLYTVSVDGNAIAWD